MNIKMLKRFFKSSFANEIYKYLFISLSILNILLTGKKPGAIGPPGIPSLGGN